MRVEACARGPTVGLSLGPRSKVALRDLDPVAIVVGAEDKGSRLAVRRAATHLARLPIQATIDSLNASVASAIALYEVGRQRRNAGAPTGKVPSADPIDEPSEELLEEMDAEDEDPNVGD